MYRYCTRMVLFWGGGMFDLRTGFSQDVSGKRDSCLEDGKVHATYCIRSFAIAPCELHLPRILNEHGRSKLWLLDKIYGFLESCHLSHQRAIMADNVQTAERIAHRLVRHTKSAIAWTGAVQAFFSALDLLWTLWSAWREGREDERRRERQDREDERRRKKADREERKRDAAIEQLKTEMKTVR